MNAPRIALVTCAALPALDPDDRLLAEALRELGAEVETPVWNAPAVEWRRYDLALLRSPWDYHLERDRFVAWAAATATVTTLLNPSTVIAWNTDKSYLRALAEQGVPTVPTAWVERERAAARLAAAVASGGWSGRDVIVKPTIGLGSSGLLRVSPGEQGDAGQAHLARLVADGDVMVQPFLDSLEREGELSLVYFGGELSHVVRKRPVAGEFRVQPEFGAAAIPEQPTEKQLEVAGRALAAIGAMTADSESELVYARVDLVTGDDGTPLLMELELVEPTLYLESAPGSADRLARLVVERATDAAVV
ncbi:MAG TPA: hypothetical protein VGM91_06105 [Conexibacter sp.]